MSLFLSMSWFFSISSPVVSVVTVVGDVFSDDGISFSLKESASKIIPPLVSGKHSAVIMIKKIIFLMQKTERERERE